MGMACATLSAPPVAPSGCRSRGDEADAAVSPGDRHLGRRRPHRSPSLRHRALSRLRAAVRYGQRSHTRTMQYGFVLPGGTAVDHRAQAALADEAGWLGVFVREAAYTPTGAR